MAGGRATSTWTAADVPADGDELAVALHLPPGDAVAAIRQVHGKIGMEARAQSGAGELAIVALLEAGWPARPGMWR